MHELILLRHAAAEPAAIDAADFERALSAHGRLEAAQAAQRLAGEAPAIDRILYSPARRTSETAQALAAALSLEASAVLAQPSLYAATADGMRAVIAESHGGARALVVVGHNPGISELASELAGKRRHLATAGYWRVALDAPAWEALVRRRGGTGRSGTGP